MKTKIKYTLTTLLLFATIRLFAAGPFPTIQPHPLQIPVLLKQVLANMVFIKGGAYLMGTHEKKYIDFLGDNANPHPVHLSSFYFPKYLSSFQQLNTYYLSTHQEGKLANRKLFEEFGQYPAHANWHIAQTYCKWLAKHSGLPFSLPTEAQWEYVARNRGQDDPYPTNNGKMELGKNYPDNNTFDDFDYHGLKGRLVLPVNDLPVNKLSIHQMGGNVSEWMKDWYSKSYYWNSPEDNPQGPKTDNGNMGFGAPLKVIRGMTHSSMGIDSGWQQEATSYARDSLSINKKLTSFRCVINNDKPLSVLLSLAKAQMAKTDTMQ